MWRATLKSLLGRKLRLVLTALSIVLGVGFVAGTYVLTDTMNAAFDELFGQIAQGSDVVIRSHQAFTPAEAGPGGGGEEREPVPESLLETVRSVPGVANATGEVSGYAAIVDPATGEPLGGFGPPTLGGNWNDVGESVLEIREGAPPTSPNDVVVDAATAESTDLEVGERVRVIFQRSTEEFTISGIAGFGEADNLGGATLALFDTGTAQRVLDKEGEFDSISVIAAEGEDPTTLRAAVAKVLPSGVEAVTSTSVGDEQAEQVQEGLGFFRIALLTFAAIALFVGSFIIFNTFSIIVAQRTRELALLRALGASRAQVMTSVIVEAVVIGLVASAVGIVVGIGIAVGLQGLLAAFNIDLPSTALQIQPRTVVASLVVGVAVTTLAAILPARRASHVAPVQALREGEIVGVPEGLGRRVAAGAAVGLAGVGFLSYGLFGTPSNAGWIVGAGAALTFLGVAMVSPVVARPVAGAVGAPLRRGAVQAKLGRQNAIRSPRRTASTASALMIGLGLVAMVSILASSLKASSSAALEETLRADFILTTTSFVPFSADVAATVRDLPEVTAVAEERQGGFRVGGDTSFLTGTDVDTIGDVATLEIESGSLEALRDPDSVLVFDDTAAEHGWKVGDTITASFATVGKRPLTVAGIFGENRLIGGDYVVSMPTYESLFTNQLDQFALVKVADGTPAPVAKTSIDSALGDFGNIEVQDQAAFRDRQAGFVNQLLGLVSALLFLAILIALFGIVNTLGLSIYERTRELGLLRAVGMSRTQVKRMIRWESILIAVFGAILGIVIGIGFGFALQRALAPEGITELDLPIGQLIAYLILAGLAGVVAAIWPARRAAKLNVLEAISYE